MSPRRPASVLALLASCSLGVAVACGRPAPGDETGEPGSSGGEGTLGMGATSVTPTAPVDPSLPTGDPSTPTITASSITGDPTTGVATGFTTDITSGFTTGAPPTSTTFEPDSSTGATTGEPLPRCNEPPGQPQDAVCTDPSGCGCASEKCFIIPIVGGFCGQCLVDADCPGGGCTLPSPVSGTGAVCNAGQAGDGCMSDAVCAGPTAPACGLVLKVPGVISVRTCGECASDGDCSAGEPHCSPDYAVLDFGGTLVCAADGSRANDTGCNLGGTGDAACTSGHCSEVVVMGLVSFGLCGACSVDADCPMNTVCGDPRVNLDTGATLGARCLPATCENQQKDADETATDCGGPCFPCP